MSKGRSAYGSGRDKSLGYIAVSCRGNVVQGFSPVKAMGVKHGY